jgi:hypothetical protein
MTGRLDRHLAPHPPTVTLHGGPADGRRVLLLHDRDVIWIACERTRTGLRPILTVSGLARMAPEQPSPEVEMLFDRVDRAWACYRRTGEPAVWRWVP